MYQNLVYANPNVEVEHQIKRICKRKGWTMRDVSPAYMERTGAGPHCIIDQNRGGLLIVSGVDWFEVLVDLRVIELGADFSCK